MTIEDLAVGLQMQSVVAGFSMLLILAFSWGHAKRLDACERRIQELLDEINRQAR